MHDVRFAAIRLFAAAVLNLQADGIAALGVASTMLLGLLARRRGRPVGPMTVTMLGTGTHAMLDRVVDHPGCPESPTVDPGGYSFHTLYRMYPSARGHLYLAAPDDDERRTLVALLSAQPGPDPADLADLPREDFVTATGRGPLTPG
jgi:hypothetical protein